MQGHAGTCMHRSFMHQTLFKVLIIAPTSTSQTNKPTKTIISAALSMVNAMSCRSAIQMFLALLCLQAYLWQSVAAKQVNWSRHCTILPDGLPRQLCRNYTVASTYDERMCAAAEWKLQHPTSCECLHQWLSRIPSVICTYLKPDHQNTANHVFVQSVCTNHNQVHPEPQCCLMWVC